MLAYGSRTDARHLGESRSVPDNGQVNENFGVYRSLRISETNGMSVVSGRRLTGFLAGLRRRIRVLCQPRSENCPGLPIFFGEAAGIGIVKRDFTAADVAVFPERPSLERFGSKFTSDMDR